MALGTSCKPIGRSEYDLDFVLTFTLLRKDVDPIQLLGEVERRLRENPTYDNILEVKRRCVRLNYAGDFHMDILPSVPDVFTCPKCILVPDVPDDAPGTWSPSNPRGYVDWFEKQANQVNVEQVREMFAAKPIPEEQHIDQKPPLKVAVQLLKRHRDIAFLDIPDRAPISIIITTLAGNAYSGSPTVAQTIDAILSDILMQVQSTQGILEVWNPANDGELLSERWNENPQLYLAFKRWVRRALKDWSELQQTKSSYLYRGLGGFFGEEVTTNALNSQADMARSLRGSGLLGVSEVGLMGSLDRPAMVNPIKDHTFYGSG
jgi:hypothetical protein